MNYSASIHDSLTHCIHDKIPDLISLRHRFHSIPEKAFHESKTAKLIQSELDKIGCSYKDSIAETGIMVTITGHLDGDTVAIRSDMDGLKIGETSTKSYMSQHPGYSHACGHDGHIVCLLGVVHALYSLRDKLAGSFRIIFQPAEETAEGAKKIIESGILGVPLPKAIFSLHAWPYLECGVVACRVGAMTAACDDFTILIRGKGGHSARPEECNNPITKAAQVIQTFASYIKDTNFFDFTSIASICMIEAGDTINTIPDTALLKGTIRSANEGEREKMKKKIINDMFTISLSDSYSITTKFHAYTPEVINHPSLFQLFVDLTNRYFVKERVAILKQSSTGSEDFGFFTKKIPGLLVRLGMGKEYAPLHSSQFDFCDNALESGIDILCRLAFEAAQSHYVL